MTPQPGAIYAFGDSMYYYVVSSAGFTIVYYYYVVLNDFEYWRLQRPTTTFKGEELIIQ